MRKNSTRRNPAVLSTESVSLIHASDTRFPRELLFGLLENARLQNIGYVASVPSSSRQPPIGLLEQVLEELIKSVSPSVTFRQTLSLEKFEHMLSLELCIHHIKYALIDREPGLLLKLLSHRHRSNRLWSSNAVSSNIFL
jgi:hypothetical protein